jgi:hypothetical protein
MKSGIIIKSVIVRSKRLEAHLLERNALAVLALG